MERKKFVKAITAKGFRQAKSTHHDTFIYFTRDGKRTEVRTRVSRSAKVKQFDRSLESQIARQCGVGKADLRKFVDCSVDQVAYEALLRAAGLID